MQTQNLATSRISVRLLIFSWLLVGSLDICSAFATAWLRNDLTPSIVCRYIASALFGRAAFQSGEIMVWIGLLMHYAIAFIWTLCFFFVYTRARLFRFAPFLVGVAYGIFIWLMMNLLIVPLTSARQGPFNIAGITIDAGILVIAMGIPLTTIANKQYNKLDA